MLPNNCVSYHYERDRTGPSATWNIARRLYVYASHSVVSNSLWAHGWYSIWLLSPWDSPGKNKGLGSQFLLQHACWVPSVMSTQPHGLKPTKLLCPWDSPSKNTGVSFHFLFQWIFPILGSPGIEKDTHQSLKRIIFYFNGFFNSRACFPWIHNSQYKCAMDIITWIPFPPGDLVLKLTCAKMPP